MFMPGDDSSRYMVCLIGRFAGCEGEKTPKAGPV